MLDKLFEDWRVALATGEGVEEASEAFFKDLRGFVDAVIWNTLRRRDAFLQQDIVTQVFLKAKSFRGESNFATWVWRLAYTQCISDVRRKLHRKEVAFDEIYHSPIAPDRSHKNFIERFAELREKLSTEDCKLIDLRLEGWSLVEIGKQRGLTEDQINVEWRAVKNRIKRHLGLKTSWDIDNARVRNESRK